MIDADLSAFLYDVWVRPDAARVQALREATPVPGRLAMRTRYETLPDLSRSGLSAGALALPRDVWDRQAALLDEADSAVQGNRQDAGAAALAALADSHVEGLHPLPLIDAEIGFGDLARQRDDPEGAIRHYAKALQLARRHRCRFAEVRAGLSLGYTQLNSVGASAARESFTRAIDVARDRDWRLEWANALVGRGECTDRLGDPTNSMRDLLDALLLFTGLRSTEGTANATLHLGEVCRRLRWTDDAHGWYSKALEAAQSRGAPITVANALDGLAEVEVEQRRYRQARRHLGQAARISADAYPRGFAHALNGLARCAFAEGRVPTALRLFDRARKLYVNLDLPTSAATSCAGIARCGELLDEPDLAVTARLDAIAHIERSRAGQVTHRDQGEYFQRFGAFYGQALRTALRYGRLDAFVAVFEAMAGRRLAGLLKAAGRGSDQAVLLAQLAQFNLEARKRPMPDDLDPARRRNRLIGRIALGGSLPGMARQALDDVLATAYQPFDPDGAADLWQQATHDRAALVVLAEDETAGELFWLAAVRGQRVPHGGSRRLPRETVELLGRIRSGLPLDATLRDIEPLDALLPPELVDLLPTGETITVVPAGRLWHVPWPAVHAPTGTDPACLLVERAPLVLAPSLAYAAFHDPRQRPDRPVRRVSWWRSTQVVNHVPRALAALDADADADAEISVRALSHGTEARAAILRGTDDLLVLIAHGRPMPEMVHYLDLDDALAVTPADLLEATPPRELVFVTCWGAASPGAQPGDPLSIVTVALTRGTRSVAATTSELRDDALSTAYVNRFLHRCLTRPIPQALHETAVAALSRRELRDGYLARWAPLVAFGS